MGVRFSSYSNGLNSSHSSIPKLRFQHLSNGDPFLILKRKIKKEILNKYIGLKKITKYKYLNLVMIRTCRDYPKKLVIDAHLWRVSNLNS